MSRRILISANTFPPRINGVAVVIKQILTLLRERGDEVLLLAPPGSASEYPGVKIVLGSGFVSCIQPDEAVPFPPHGLADVLRDFRPDVVHVIDPHVLSPQALAAVRCARQLSLPLLLSVQTNYEMIYRDLGVRGGMQLIVELSAKILNRGDLVTFAGSTTAETFGRYLSCPYTTWLGGVDVNTFHPARADAKWRERLTAGEPEKLLFLSAGRLSPEKKVALLRPLVDRFPDARFAIVGDGNQRAKLEQLFANTPTVFTGALSHEELGAVYASSDVFLFPSTMDANGLVGLESLASGCPVIGARVGGIPEFVQDGVNGFLFQPDDLSSLFAAAERAVRGSAFRSMREACRATALEHSWDTRREQLDGIYDALIHSAKAGTKLNQYRTNSAPPALGVASRVYGTFLETLLRVAPLELLRAMEKIEGPLAVRRAAMRMARSLPA